MHFCRNLSRRIKSVAVVARLVAAPCLAQSPSASLERCAPPPASQCAVFNAIDSVARDMIATFQTPGLAVGVVRNGQLIFNKGYGKSNLELDVPVTPATVWPIFSITKTFTAAAILRLAER